MGRGILLTEEFGSGHTLAAWAVAEAWNSRHPDRPVEVVRGMERTHPGLTRVVIAAYVALLRRWPDAYRWLYRVTEDVPAAYGGASKLLTALYARPFATWMSKAAPSWAMTTHPFFLALLDRLRRQGWRGKFGALVTDFHVHRFWWWPSADWYCVPFPWMRDELAVRGYPPERVFVTGFPVRKMFSLSVSRPEVEMKFGWPSSRRVLCMGGGFGLGDVVRWLDWLDASALDFEVAVVAGRNRKLYESLRRLQGRWRRVCRVLGYCESIHELYVASDVLVTKPGAATVMEAAAMGLPFVCAPPLPGHEEDNARVLTNLGIISGPCAGTEMREAVEQLLLDETARRRIKEKLSSIARPDAAESVADVLGSEGIE